jgi:hypothetical protein
MFNLRRGLACSLAMSASIALAEAPPPIPIENPQVAARAGALAVNAYSEASRATIYLVDRPRYIVDATLKQLAAQTTPAAAATRSGSTAPCPFGGEIRARFPLANPQVLRLVWDNCVIYQSDGTTVTYHGEGRLRLPAQTFAPEHAEALHLGGELYPFIESNVYADTPGDLYEQKYDLAIVGRLPLTRFRGVGIFTGAFDYALDGTFATRSVSVFDPAFPPNVYETFNTADGIRAVGSVVHTEQDTVVTEDLTLRRGSFEAYAHSESFPMVRELAFTAYNWHVTRDLRVTERTSSHWVEGRVDFKFPPFVGSCADGVYSFRTVVPIRYADVFSSAALDQGTVVLNQSARLTLALTDVPTSNPSWYTPQPGDLITQAVIKQGRTELANTSSYYIGSTLQDLGRCAP